MRVETLILGIVAVAASAMDLYLWRTSANLARRVAALKGRCECAESEKRALESALASLKSEENNRISRLEHDLRSPLGVIRGFSTLLKEFVENHAQDLPKFPLRTVNGIDQAVERMLRIIEADTDGEAPRSREDALVQGENQYR